MHAGIDYGAPEGTPVYAGVEGTWLSDCASGCLYGPGWVKVKTVDGYVVLYGHITPVPEIKGPITPNTIIGYVGDFEENGYSSDDHLHFEVSKDGNYYNPGSLMDTKTKDVYVNHVSSQDFHQVPEYPGLWTSPLSQPVIHHGGTPIWVMLGICESKGYGDMTIGGQKYENRFLGIRC